MKLLKRDEDFKQSIILAEATTNKIISANPLCNKNPKLISLIDTFKIKNIVFC